MIGADFVVTAQPSGFEEPGEGPFDNPALALHMEAFASLGRFHNVQAQFAAVRAARRPLALRNRSRSRSWMNFHVQS